jgi:poly(hydroxyalkanoate) depolymerase family esterase
MQLPAQQLLRLCFSRRQSHCRWHIGTSMWCFAPVQSNKRATPECEPRYARERRTHGPVWRARLMPKSFASIWLRGIKRLMKIEAERIAALDKRRRKATRKTKPATAADKLKAGTARTRTRAARLSTAGNAATLRSNTNASSAVRPRLPASERSRVRPRAGAWTQGTWMRSYFSAPPAAGDLVNHLAYGLYLPTGRRTDRLPLIVMLHGCKQNIEEFARGTRMNFLADHHSFAVLYPEQSKHAHAHRCWRWYDDSPRAGGKEAASIAALVRKMVVEHRLDPTRVYVAGLSAGAGMAGVLAMRYPQLFAAVALHSGVVFGEAHNAVGAVRVMRRGARGDPVTLVADAHAAARHPGMPALIIHGEADGVVAPVNADHLEQQFLQLNGALDAGGQLADGVRVRHMDSAGRGRASDVRVARRDFRMSNRVIVRTCRVAGLTHAWSGGDDALPFHASRGPNASALIWDFFRAHRRLEAVAESTTAPPTARTRATGQPARATRTGTL